jgi:hypothetical protein
LSKDNYRIEGRERYKVMTLAISEFIRRFLIHVLPAGFHRIRYYGLLASTTRADNIARARELLAVPMLPIEAIKAASTNANEPQTPEHPCPCCGGPHDHHRDLLARLLATVPSDGIRARNQDRHLMSPFTHVPPQSVVTCGFWSSTGYGGARPSAALVPQLTRLFSLLDILEPTPKRSLLHFNIRHQPCDRAARSPTTHPQRSKSP